MLLSEWAEAYLQTATELDPNTRFTYRRDLTRNILPRFGAGALSGWPPPRAARPVDAHALRRRADRPDRPTWGRKAPKIKAGRRRVGLPAGVAGLLADHLATYSGPGDEGLVFPNRAGNPIHPSSFNTAHRKPAKAQVGLDGLRFHDCATRPWRLPSHRAPTPRPSRPAWAIPASR